MKFNLTPSEEKKLVSLYISSGAHAIYSVQLEKRGKHYVSDFIDKSSLRFWMHKPRYLKAIRQTMDELRENLGYDFEISYFELHKLITSMDAFKSMNLEKLQKIKKEKIKEMKDKIMTICGASVLVFGISSLGVGVSNYFFHNFNNNSQIQYDIPNDNFTTKNNNKVGGLELELGNNPILTLPK